MRSITRIAAGMASVSALLVLSLVLPPAASAADYPNVPPPVTDLPSNYPSLTPQEAAARKFAISTGTQKLLFPETGFMTSFSRLSRGAGGALLAAPQAGFFLGASSVRLAFAGANLDWDGAMCSYPKWVVDAYTFASAGVGAANCNMPITTPNGDAGVPTNTYAGVTYRVVGFQTTFNGNPIYRWTICSNKTTNSSLPTSNTIAFSFNYSGGSGSLSSFQAWGAGGYSGLCGANFGRTDSGQIPLAGLGSIGPLIIKSSGTAVGTSFMDSSGVNPLRRARCIIEGAGGTMITSSWVDYYESSGLPVTAVEAACSSSWAGRSSTFKPTGVRLQSDNSGVITEIADTDVPTEMQEAAELYPDCYKGSTRCELILTRWQGGVTPKNCFTNPVLCAGWWTETGSGVTPGEYRCTWGAYAVDLTECAVYQRAFVAPGPGVAPGENTDPDGSPIPGTQPGGGTGSENPNSINPGQSVGTDSQKCMDQWFDDFNPIDWVMVPVKCALQWAFVPRATALQTMWAGAQTAWSQTMPGQLPTLLAGVFTPPSGGSGCMGPHVSIPFSTVNAGWPNFDAYPLAACTAPMSNVASTARTIGAAVLLFMTGLGIVRRVSATVNAPGVGGGES